MTDFFVGRISTATCDNAGELLVGVAYANPPYKILSITAEEQPALPVQVSELPLVRQCLAYQTCPTGH